MAAPATARTARRSAPAAGGGPASPARAGLAVGLPTALAAVLVLSGITGRSLGFDEGATAARGAQHGSALWAAIAHDGGNMSGYYLLLHVLIGLFGNGLLVLRIVPALGVVATVALTGVIALRLFDPVVALLGGVLTAVSLPLVYWGQTARAYAPMVAFVCMAMLAFIGLAGGDPDRAPRRGAWLGFVAAMTLAMYCSFVAVLVVPAQLLAVARRRGAWGRLGSALAAVAVLCIPLAVLALRRGSGQLFWVPRPSSMVDSQVLQSLTSAGLAPNFHPGSTTHLLMWATVGAVMGQLAVLAWRLARGARDWPLALVLGWAILPAALTFVYSLAFQPIFVPRNVLTSTPAVSLALASVARHRRRVPGLAVAVGAAALVAVLTLRALPLGAAYGVSPEPWNTVTARVLRDARPGDCIAFYPADAQMAFRYYLGDSPAAQRRAPRPILPEAGWAQVRPYVEDYATLSPAQLARRAAGCRRLWFVSSHEGQANGPAGAIAHRRRFFALGAVLDRRFGVAPVARYGYASTIHVELFGGPGTIRPRR